MGRPLKPDDKRRKNLLRVRVTDQEKSRIEQLAADAGLTPSDYLRGSVLHTKPARNVPTPDRALLLKVLAELNKLGSNHNQIARALNRRQGSEDLIGFDLQQVTDASFAIIVFTKHLLDILK